MIRIPHKYRLSFVQTIGLALFIVTALFYNCIANDCSSLSKDSIQKERNFSIPPIIPYGGKTIDKLNRNVGPFDKQNVKSVYYRHWLGTDALGRDVLAGIIHGSHIALKVGFWSSVFSLLIGIFLGYLSGYFGNKQLKLSKGGMALFVLSLFVSLFYVYYASSILKYLTLLVPLALFVILRREVKPFDSSVISFPLDLVVFRIVEIFKSIPDLFMILVALAFFQKPSIWNVILVITVIRWPNITHHLRSEILKIKEANFIKSAKALGQRDSTIFFNDIMPLTFSPIIILTAFGFASAVLVESTLSFLGIGVPLDMVTWGSLLKDARFNFGSWWLVIFPGLMIYLVIALFNSIGNTISNQLQGNDNLEKD